MKNYKETDQIIKDRLEQYDSGVPMHLFDKIEEGLGTVPEQKKLGGTWWMFGLLILMLGGASWYMVSSSSLEHANNNTTNEKSKRVLASSVANQQVVTKEEIPTTSATFSNNSATSTNKKEIDTKDLTLKNNASANKVIASEKVTAPTHKVISTIDWQTQSHLVSNNNIHHEEQLVSKSQQHPTNSFFSKGKISTDSPLTVKANQERKSILTAKKLDEAFGQQVPALVNLNVKYNSEFQLPDIVKCGNKKDRKFNLNFTTSMDLFVSPERSFRFLEYKSNEYEEYAAKRNETEKAYYSFSSGLRLNFLAENGLAIRTGLVYAQINEIFEDQLLVQELLINPISGDTVGFTQYLNDVTTFNRYKMVDIPLMVGYELPMKRSTINVNAGVFVNVKATQKGNLLDVEETKRDFSTGSGDYEVFRKNLGLSYFLSLGAAYELSPQYQFFFEPHLRYYPGSFTKKEYVLNQKYMTGGILLGIRKRL